MEGDIVASFCRRFLEYLTGIGNCTFYFLLQIWQSRLLLRPQMGRWRRKWNAIQSVLMMVAPAKRPTTEPAEYADPNTPTAMASLAGGNVSQQAEGCQELLQTYTLNYPAR